MKKKPWVYQEDVKTRHTAHWDWDYLTWKEIEHLLKEAGVREDQQNTQIGISRKKKRLMFIIWIGLGLLIVSVMVLVIGLR